VNRRAVLLFAILVVASGGAYAERLTIATSASEISISASFTGTPLTVFGVIEREEATPLPLEADYKVAVLILGPRQSVIVRKKDRFLGIWANAASQTIINPPSVYLLSTSVDLPRLASPAVLQRLQLGYDNIDFVYEGLGTVNDPEAAEFRDAFLRLKEESRLYSQNVGVSFIGNLVFRTAARLPANLPTGDYTVIGYLFSGNELIARSEERIAVSKTGFEATLASFARTQSLPYGIIVVAMALAIGWLGGVIFRRD
jgi:uncharacterized protein (TIGR02186 family)